MIDDLAKLLDRVSSPADLAVILLSGPLAYVLDAGLDVIGFLPPGYVAIVTACLALGIKKTIEVRIAPRRERRFRETRMQEARRRARALGTRLEVHVLPPELMATLHREVDLFEAGITTEAQFDEAFADCLATYRRQIGLATDSGVPRSRR